jgi:transposase-like protein
MPEPKKIEEQNWQSPGVCPACKNEGLEYGDHYFDEDNVVFHWVCPKCGSSGTETHVMEFVEHELDEDEEESDEEDSHKN